MHLHIPVRARSWRSFQQRANSFNTPVTVEVIDEPIGSSAGVLEATMSVGVYVQIIRITAYNAHTHYTVLLRHDIVVEPVFKIADVDMETHILAQLLTAKAVQEDVYSALLGQTVTILIKGAPARDRYTDDLRKRAKSLGVEPLEYTLA